MNWFIANYFVLVNPAATRNSQPLAKMILIGYRLVFESACALLNVHVNPDSDYVEDERARTELERALLLSIGETKLTIFEMPDGTYYLGLRPEICREMLPDIMPAYEMSDRIAMLSIEFHREIKKIGVFKYMKNTNTYLQEPCAIQFNFV